VSELIILKFKINIVEENSFNHSWEESSMIIFLIVEGIIHDYKLHKISWITLDGNKTRTCRGRKHSFNLIVSVHVDRGNIGE